MAFAATLLAFGLRAAAESCERPATLKLDALRQVGAARAPAAVCAAEAIDDRPGGLAELRWNDRLAEAARRQAFEMAAVGGIGHRDRADRALAARLGAVGYAAGLAFENVAFGYRDVTAVVAAWRASEAHCLNLRQAAIAEIGLACADRDGTRYWALLLASPATPRAASTQPSPERAAIADSPVRPLPTWRDEALR